MHSNFSRPPRLPGWQAARANSTDAGRLRGRPPKLATVPPQHPVSPHCPLHPALPVLAPYGVTEKLAAWLETMRRANAEKAAWQERRAGRGQHQLGVVSPGLPWQAVVSRRGRPATSEKGEQDKAVGQGWSNGQAKQSKEAEGRGRGAIACDAASPRSRAGDAAPAPAAPLARRPTQARSPAIYCGGMPGRMPGGGMPGLHTNKRDRWSRNQVKTTAAPCSGQGAVGATQSEHS